MRNKKGHRYIVPNQGPQKPTRNTQAMPVLPNGKRAPTLCITEFQNFAVLIGTPKSSVNFFNIQLSVYASRVIVLLQGKFIENLPVKFCL